jgi:uncharacterized protein (DUF1810 family)
MMNDPFALDRFVTAQDGIYDIALGEIRRGAKRSHWIWFIFPQIAGLGTSPMAQRYAIGSLGEARAYLEHAVLGPRYRQCVAALQDLGGTTADSIFGGIDAMKLRSSLTLFERRAASPCSAPRSIAGLAASAMTGLWLCSGAAGRVMAEIEERTVAAAHNCRRLVLLCPC